MFCPLCKSEFHDGFAQCSDCHIPLIASEAEAESMPVDCLWKGDDSRRCNEIIDALLAAEIPFYSKESLKKRPWPWISLIFWQVKRPQPTVEFQIRVLHRDLVRAEAAVPPEPKDNWDDDEDEADKKPALT